MATQLESVINHLRSTEDLQNQLLGVGTALFWMAVADAGFCRFTKARWMALHTLANVVVCIFSAADSLRAADDPSNSCMGHVSSDIATQQIVALHLYHLALFECTRDDWAHHALFVGVIGGFGLSFDAGGPLRNLIAFFMCGLPGGLDYMMLTLVKHDVISPLTEKTWNTRINVWIRSPGLLLAAFCIYQAARNGPPSSGCAIHPYIAGALGALCVANGQYYMQRVTGNTYRKVQRFSS
mgnify:CR=1 FL=1|jgi:hypothetical protein